MLKTDDILSHYKIISSIGAGGMGEVYLATDARLERQVALKVLLGDVSDDADRVERFVREAKAASALNHPNILTVFEIGTFESSHYIATEFINGKTLRDRILTGSMDVNDALAIALQVAAALGAAHEAGIIHRDIKPENIMVREDGLVKVLDFGLAKLTEKQPETAASEDATRAQFNTKPGLIMGTVAYMSPEQARGQKLDARSDIFSLGIVLYEMFGGRRPFAGESNVDLISSILKDDPPPIRQLSPLLPRQLERIVDKTLRKDKAQRYQHVKDLEIDLADLREEIKLEALINRTNDQSLPTPVTQTGVARPTLTESISTTRRFTLLHAIIFAALAVAVVAGIWFMRGGRNADAATYKSSEVASWTSAAGELFSSAKFSPDGKMIAFASTKSGTKNIWLIQTGSTEPIQITNDAFSNTDPIWSPKGDEVAYFSDRATSGENINFSGLWRVSALGGGTPKLVAQVNDKGIQLRHWSASGTIYYESKKELFAIDPTSGESRQVTSFSDKDISLIQIGADEKTLVFYEKKDEGWKIYTASLTDIGKRSVIAQGAGRVENFVWLAEKKKLFYDRPIDDVLQTFALDLESGDESRVTTSETDSSVIDATADGRSILVSSAKEESNLWKVDITSLAESPLVRDRDANLWPAVSPDNKLFAYQAIRNLSRGNHLFDSAIMIRGVTQSDEKPRLVTEAGSLPAFSPDGSTIAYLKQNNGIKDLYVKGVVGGNERRLTTTGVFDIAYSVSPYNQANANAFAFSPDGQTIAYTGKSNGGQIQIANIGNGNNISVPAAAEPNTTFLSPSFSPDGKMIAVVADRPTNSVRIIDPTLDSATQIYGITRPIRILGWSADGRSLFIAEASKPYVGLPPETILRKISIADRTETVVATLNNIYFYNIFLSNDRRQIAYAAREANKDNLYLLSVSGGIAKKITINNDASAYISRLAWFTDNSAVVFGKQTRFSMLSLLSRSDQ